MAKPNYQESDCTGQSHEQKAIFHQCMRMIERSSGQEQDKKIAKFIELVMDSSVKAKYTIRFLIEELLEELRSK